MSDKRQTVIPTTVGVAIIMLVIGVALGSVAFPLTKIGTTTQLSTVTTIVAQTKVLLSTYENNESPETISEEVLVNYIVYITENIYGNCTEYAGTVSLSQTNTTLYAFPTGMTGYQNVTLVSNVTTFQNEGSTVTTTVSSSRPPMTIDSETVNCPILNMTSVG